MAYSKIALPNDIKALPQLFEFIDRMSEEAGLDMAETMQVNLAVEEAVVNVMNYAYAEGQAGEVEIGCDTDECGMTFTVKDSGVPFDPTEKEEADTTLGVEERPIGGLGIHIVRQIMDSITYERTADGHNVLTMRKKIEKLKG